jgi:hypothetical protein
MSADVCAECAGTGAVPAMGADQYDELEDNGLVPCDQCGEQ